MSSGLDEVMKQAGQGLDAMINGWIYELGDKFGGMVEGMSEGLGNTIDAGVKGISSSARGAMDSLTPSVSAPNIGKEIQAPEIAKGLSMEVSAPDAPSVGNTAPSPEMQAALDKAGNLGQSFAMEDMGTSMDAVSASNGVNQNMQRQQQQAMGIG